MNQTLGINPFSLSKTNMLLILNKHKYKKGRKHSQSWKMRI